MSSDCPFDTAALQEIYEGDTLLFEEIMDILAIRLPLDCEELREALEEGDGKQAAALAHRVKSSLLSVAAVKASQTAADLEVVALSADLSNSLSRYSRLVFEIEAILAYYRSNEWERLFR